MIPQIIRKQLCCVTDVSVCNRKSNSQTINVCNWHVHRKHLIDLGGNNSVLPWEATSPSASRTKNELKGCKGDARGTTWNFFHCPAPGWSSHVWHVDVRCCFAHLLCEIFWANFSPFYQSPQESPGQFSQFSPDFSQA